MKNRETRRQAGGAGDVARGRGAEVAGGVGSANPQGSNQHTKGLRLQKPVPNPEIPRKIRREKPKVIKNKKNNREGRGELT